MEKLLDKTLSSFIYDLTTFYMTYT